MFLLESEAEPAVKALAEAKVPLKQIKVNPKRQLTVTKKLQSIVACLRGVVGQCVAGPEGGGGSEWWGSVSRYRSCRSRSWPNARR